MKHIKIKYCNCGNPIFPPLSEIIIDSTLSDIISRNTTRLGKGKNKVYQEEVNKLCHQCRYDRDYKVQLKCAQNYRTKIKAAKQSAKVPIEHRTSPLVDQAVPNMLQAGEY